MRTTTLAVGFLLSLAQTALAVELTPVIVSEIFTSQSGDAPLACRYQEGSCATGSSFFSFATATTIPTVASCQSGTSTISACYGGAVTRLQNALTSGRPLWVLEVAHRVKDLSTRDA